MRRAASRSTFLALATGALACGTDAPPKQAPAKVANAAPEASLATVTLSDSAVVRLGIETVRIDSVRLAPTLDASGEVIVPPGGSASLVAPVAGMILPPADGPIPIGGTRLAAGQTILRLAALPPDREMLRGDETLDVATARLTAAEANAARIESLWDDRLVSARDREQAIADLAAARAAYSAAQSQQAVVRGTPDAGTGSASLRVAAPQAGVLQQLHVVAGQQVAAGTPLAEVARLDRLWIRVPVYSGDLSRVARGEGATVTTLGGGSVLAVSPVAGPRTADPVAATVNLFFTARAGSGVLAPGERVRVALPLDGPSVAALAVPHDALIYDIHGNAWVYVDLGSHSYARQRVEVDRVVDGQAMLRRGPEAGTLIVVTGVAELFGTEFGNGK